MNKVILFCLFLPQRENAPFLYPIQAKTADNPQLLNTQFNKMKIVYIAHCIGGDVAANLADLRRIVREINLTRPDVVPLVPYYADIVSLDDTARKNGNSGTRREVLGRKPFPSGGRMFDEEITSRLDKNRESELKAKKLRESGAYVGDIAPAIEPGLQFLNCHMPGKLFNILKVHPETNSLDVVISDLEGAATGWLDAGWNVEHTKTGFNRGEYWQVWTGDGRIITTKRDTGSENAG